ncbi:hypothetical protein LTR56_024281 [Elasticomyces elasticus]|nr:hypothetical protein LTR56_024281 [Elasticomyces elasticus]
MSEKGRMPPLSETSYLEIEKNARTCWSDPWMGKQFIIDGVLRCSGKLFVTIGGSVVLPLEAGMDYVMMLLVEQFLPEGKPFKAFQVLGTSSRGELIQMLDSSSDWQRIEKRCTVSSFELRWVDGIVSIMHPQDRDRQITLQLEELCDTTAGRWLLERYLQSLKK